MYKHILVAVTLDEGHDAEKSLNMAQALADAGARITVLHAKDAIPAYAIAYMPPNYAMSLREAICDQLDNLANRFTNSEGVLVDGPSGRAILDWAEAHAVDCIIIGSHRQGLQDYFLGSTAARVVRQARCSVHVAR